MRRPSHATLSRSVNLLTCSFSSPILSVAGQCLVLNLIDLKTQTYATRGIGRGVDRQLEAFAEAHGLSPLGRDDMVDPEGRKYM